MDLNIAIVHYKGLWTSIETGATGKFFSLLIRF